MHTYSIFFQLFPFKRRLIADKTASFKVLQLRFTCPVTADPEGAYNYRVKKRAAWKNSLQFAIQEVDVSTYEKEQQQAMKAVSFVANQDRSQHGFPVQSP